MHQRLLRDDWRRGRCERHSTLGQSGGQRTVGLAHGFVGKRCLEDRHGFGDRSDALQFRVDLR